jgi:type 1 glutamine amidotransferase
MRALIVRGGWEGHQPVACTELFLPLLREHGYELTITDDLDVYADAGAMRGLDLIVQCWTRGRLTEEQEKGLLACVHGGTGFAGWHGGVVASFHEAGGYQYMMGGRFVCHPGGFVDYDVNIVGDHSIVDGVGAFSVHTEQYFCHFDPTLTVLATTTFTGAHGAPETDGAVIPVVWLRRYGQGRVFVCTLGHAPEDLQVPQTRTIVERGLIWAGER